jgi:hypothetical protein
MQMLQQICSRVQQGLVRYLSSIVAIFATVWQALPRSCSVGQDGVSMKTPNRLLFLVAGGQLLGKVLDLHHAEHGLVFRVVLERQTPVERFEHLDVVLGCAFGKPLLQQLLSRHFGGKVPPREVRHADLLADQGGDPAVPDSSLNASPEPSLPATPQRPTALPLAAADIERGPLGLIRGGR